MALDACEDSVGIGIGAVACRGSLDGVRGSSNCSKGGQSVSDLPKIVQVRSC